MTRQPAPEFGVQGAAERPDRGFADDVEVAAYAAQEQGADRPPDEVAAGLEPPCDR